RPIRGAAASERRDASLRRPAPSQPFHDPCGERQCGADVLGRHVVLALNLLERHTACQTADDDRDRRACAADHRLAVAYRRVDDDTIVHGEVGRLVVTGPAGGCWPAPNSYRSAWCRPGLYIVLAKTVFLS